MTKVDRFTLQTPGYNFKKAIVAGMTSMAAFAALGSLAYFFSPLSLGSVGLIDGVLGATLVPAIAAIAGMRFDQEKSMMKRGPEKVLPEGSDKPLIFN